MDSTLADSYSNTSIEVAVALVRYGDQNAPYPGLSAPLERHLPNMSINADPHTQASTTRLGPGVALLLYVLSTGNKQVSVRPIFTLCR